MELENLKLEGMVRQMEKVSWIDEVIFVFEIIGENAYKHMDNMLLFQKNTKIRLGNRILSSILKTFETIRFAVSQHSYSDAYVLLRKIRDDALLSLILIELVAKYNQESITQERSHNQKAMTEEQVAAWFESELKNTEKIGYTKFMSYFRANEVISKFIACFYEDKLKKWDRILNDHVHGNSYLSYCDNNDYTDIREAEIKELAFGLTSFILSMLILVDPSYIASSDYGDFYEQGLTPPDGSQYWVAPVFVDYMKERMSSDEVEYLRKNRKYEMEF